MAPPGGAPAKQAIAYKVTHPGKTDDVGVNTLIGDFVEKGSNHGKKFYQKVQSIKGHEDIKVFLYFWDDRDGEDFGGWWFGDSVGGTEVWARCASKDALPPRAGWKVPWDAPDPKNAIFVEPAQAAGAAAAAAPAEKPLTTEQKFKKAAEVVAKPGSGSVVVGRLSASKGVEAGAPPVVTPENQATADLVEKAKAEVAAADEAANAAITLATSALDPDSPAPASDLKDIMTKLQDQQTALGEGQKKLTQDMVEVRKSGPKSVAFVAELAKLVPKIRATVTSVNEQLNKVKASVNAAENREKNAKKEAEDTKELNEFLPEAKQMSASVLESVEALMSLADPIVASPPPDDSDDLKNAFNEIETTLNEAQTKIAEARKQIAGKLGAAKNYAPETRKTALSEYTALQASLTEAQKTLMSYKNFRKDFKAKVAAKKALVDLAEKISDAELEVEKAEMMCVAADSGLMPEEDIAATEKAIEPALKEVQTLIGGIAGRLNAAQGSLRDELMQTKEKALALKKQCDDVKNKMKDQRMQLSAKEMASKVTEKVVAVEDALKLCHEAEMPFLKGLEVLPPDESEKAINALDSTATKAETALRQAVALLKTKQAESQRFPKELQEKAKEELSVFQERIDAAEKKVQDFRKEATERKVNAIMEEVIDAVKVAEDKVAAYAEVGKVFTDDLEKVSTEEIKEAMEKAPEVEERAATSLAEAKKVILAKAKDARQGPAAVALKKHEGSVNTAQARLASVKKAASTGEQLIKGKTTLGEEKKKVEEAEALVEKTEKAVKPLEEMEDAVETLTEEEFAEIGDNLVGGQAALKSAQKSLETQITGAPGSMRAALQKLLERCKAGLAKTDKFLEGQKPKKEEVLSKAYSRMANKRTEHVEAIVEKVNEVELPYLKGIEDLPAAESAAALKASEDVILELNTAITETRNFLATKNIEMKSFSDKERCKEVAADFAKLSTRINASATKLATFKKDTEGRKKVSQLQEAGEKVTEVEKAVTKLAEIVSPLSNVGDDPAAAAPSEEEAGEICEKASKEAKTVQGMLDECRKFLAERQKDKLPNSADTLKDLMTRVKEATDALTKAKKSFQEQEHKFLGKRVLKEVEELISGLEGDVKAAEESCAALLARGGEEFLVAASLRTLANALLDYMSKESKDISTLFKDVGSGKNIEQEVFVAWLEKLPEAIAHPEVDFKPERREKLFKLVSADDGTEVIDEAKFKDMFTMQFVCVQGISMTSQLQTSGGETVCKVEPKDVLEAVGAVSKDEAGVERVEAKIVSSGKSGFVTIKGNQGSVYLKASNPFEEYCKEMDKAVEERANKVKQATASLHKKGAELQDSAGGASKPLAEARTEFANLRKKAAAQMVALQALKAKINEGKKEFLKVEAAEKVAHIEAQERKEAEAITGDVTKEAEMAETLVKQVEELAEPLLSLKGAELQSFSSPASVQEAVEKLVPEAVDALGKVKVAAQETLKSLAKATKGPMMMAKRDMGQMIGKLEAATKKCQNKLAAVKKACEEIVGDSSAKASKAVRDSLRSAGSDTDQLFKELAEGGDKISEVALWRKLLALPELEGLQPEHAKLICRKIAQDGGISKRALTAFVQKYFQVVTKIAITTEFDVGQGKVLRKLDADELVEVVEGPTTDPDTKLARVKGRSLVDDTEGWISIKGNQGSMFLKEAEKPIYAVSSEQEVRLSSDMTASAETVRMLKPGEVLELLKGPVKETFEPGLKARAKALDDDVKGWFNIRDKDNVYAEPAGKMWTVTAAVAMTDNEDIKNCEVVKKLAVGEQFVVEEEPVEDKDSGVKRIKGKLVDSDKEGWITVKGSAGTVYCKASDKHYTILREVPMLKTQAANSEVERQLGEGEVVHILEGPKQEAYPPVLRVQVKACTDGAAGWVTMAPTSVKRWTGIYKCLAAMPLHSSSKVEGAEELRSLTVGEMLEIQAGPMEEDGETRVKVKSKKDGLIGWATMFDESGKRTLMTL
eukprot:TRINITY_DN72430_c0_g1_i1.p1 TRINITY_DN72430_c0_g1~~TRINITY_DN72430_c0_g1_i1.p1  ORF type:complete len:1990 (-),score=675.87 TRINITY_DN72430_c0_g1_i1:92-6022(-)